MQIQEIEFIKNEDIALNEKECNGFLYPRYNQKPTEESIKQLREQKQQKRRAYNEPIEINTDEQETALSFIKWNCNATQREKDINATIEKLKGLQQKKGITEFSREFLKTLLSHYTTLDRQVKDKRIRDIMSRAKSIKERQVKSYKLHLNGCYVIQREPVFNVEEFISFI